MKSYHGQYKDAYDAESFMHNTSEDGTEGHEVIATSRM